MARTKRNEVAKKVTPVETQDEREMRKSKEAFEKILQFAKMTKNPIWNIEDQSTRTTPRYTRYAKEDLLNYMQTPSTNEANIRNASIYMYDSSTQYKRLIQYYSFLLDWVYTIAPLNYDPTKIKEETFRKAYYKVSAQLETMNIPHEMQRATQITLKEGIIYGAIWQSGTSFFIQRINPDYCVLTSIVDGTWNYAVDMSKISEKMLPMYPPEFATMYNAYQTGGNKYQEVPESISFCLKADETNNNYSLPPYASALPMLYDIETYKALQETSTEIGNYKLLAMKIDTDEKGIPLLDWDLAQKYYRQLCASLPPYVGAVVTPMDMSSFEFDKSRGVNDVDTVSRAEEQFWGGTGTSPLLFGSIKSNTAGVLKLSIKSDEELMLGLQKQAERLINRILKNMSGTVKFKINFLPITKFNQEEKAAIYKEAATLGIPGSKAAYAATVGIPQTDLLGMNYIEMNLLDMGNLTPLVSGYTSSSNNDDSGRPELDDGDLTAEGEQTREKGSNENVV